MALEHLVLDVPPGFNPSNSQHVKRVIERVVEAERQKNGTSASGEDMGENRQDWKILTYDDQTNKLTIYRQSAVTQLGTESRGKREVGIPTGTKASELEGIAARLQEMNPGYYLARADLHLGQATLAKMTLEEYRVREALATALGVRPWDVEDVRGSSKVGYTMKLPSSYMASKHDDKLQEVAETVAGVFGWYFETNPVTLKARIVPSLPPMFPASIPYPMELLPKPTPGLVNPIPFGMTLPERGDEESEVAWLKMEDAPHTQVGGTSGSGKDLALDTVLPTPDGHTTMGDVKVGDVVLSRNGRPTRVLSVSDIIEQPELFRVTFHDGQTLDAGRDHQWVVVRVPGDTPTKNPTVEIDTVAALVTARAALVDECLASAEDIAACADIPQWTSGDLVRSQLLFMGIPEHGGLFSLKASLSALGERLTWLSDEHNKLAVYERIMTTAEMLADGGEFAIRAARPQLNDEALWFDNSPYSIGVGVGIHHGGEVTAQVQARLSREGESERPRKDVPKVYLRGTFNERLSVVQGLMDTAGDIHGRTCVLPFASKTILSLIRSLGIVAVSEGDSVYFVTDEHVFDTRPGYDALPHETTFAERALYITSITSIDSRPTRCIQVDSPDATYLVGDFIPTHNSVTLNSIVAGALAAGAELAVIDVPAKAVDYEKWRPFVRKGGWGCESFEENAVVLQELYKEGARRADTLKRYGAKKLTELPPDILATMNPVLIVCDEVTGLYAPANEKPPKGLPKDHPLVVEAEAKATASAMIQSYIAKIAAELRFVGFKLILATQVASTQTGIGTALRTNLGNKMLLGARATKGNRALILADVSSAPEVPEHIQQAEGLIPKGVGVSELEAQRPYVFKSFYASEDDFIAELNRRGLHGLELTQLDQTRPDPAVVRDTFPESAEAQMAERFEPKFGKNDAGPQPHQVDPVTGERLDGRQAANRARHLLTIQAKQAARD